MNSMGLASTAPTSNVIRSTAINSGLQRPPLSISNNMPTANSANINTSVSNGQDSGGMPLATPHLSAAASLSASK